MEALPLPPAVQDGLDEISGGGLPLGAGDADDLHRPGGVPPGGVGQQAHGGPHVGDPDTGGGDAVIGALAHIGEGAAAHGLGEVLLLKGGPLADEKTPGHSGAGVAGHSLHRPGEGGGQGPIFGQETVFQQQLVVIPQGEAGPV